MPPVKRYANRASISPAKKNQPSERGSKGKLPINGERIDKKKESQKAVDDGFEGFQEKAKEQPTDHKLINKNYSSTQSISKDKIRSFRSGNLSHQSQSSTNMRKPTKHQNISPENKELIIIDPKISLQQKADQKEQVSQHEQKQEEAKQPQQEWLEEGQDQELSQEVSRQLSRDDSKPSSREKVKVETISQSNDQISYMGSMHSVDVILERRSSSRSQVNKSKVMDQSIWNRNEFRDRVIIKVEEIQPVPALKKLEDQFKKYTKRFSANKSQRSFLTAFQFSQKDHHDDSLKRGFENCDRNLEPIKRLKLLESVAIDFHKEKKLNQAIRSIEEAINIIENLETASDQLQKQNSQKSHSQRLKQFFSDFFRGDAEVKKQQRQRKLQQSKQVIQELLLQPDQFCRRAMELRLKGYLVLLNQQAGIETERDIKFRNQKKEILAQFPKEKRLKIEIQLLECFRTDREKLSEISKHRTQVRNLPFETSAEKSVKGNLLKNLSDLSKSIIESRKYKKGPSVKKQNHRNHNRQVHDETGPIEINLINPQDLQNAFVETLNDYDEGLDLLQETAAQKHYMTMMEIMLSILELVSDFKAERSQSEKQRYEGFDQRFEAYRIKMEQLKINLQSLSGNSEVGDKTVLKQQIQFALTEVLTKQSENQFNKGNYNNYKQEIQKIYQKFRQAQIKQEGPKLKIRFLDKRSEIYKFRLTQYKNDQASARKKKFQEYLQQLLTMEKQAARIPVYNETFPSIYELKALVNFELNKYTDFDKEFNKSLYFREHIAKSEPYLLTAVICQKVSYLNVQVHQKLIYEELKKANGIKQDHFESSQFSRECLKPLYWHLELAKAEFEFKKLRNRVQTGKHSCQEKENKHQEQLGNSQKRLNDENLDDLISDMVPGNCSNVQQTQTMINSDAKGLSTSQLPSQNSRVVNSNQTKGSIQMKQLKEIDKLYQEAIMLCKKRLTDSNNINYFAAWSKYCDFMKYCVLKKLRNSFGTEKQQPYETVAQRLKEKLVQSMSDQELNSSFQRTTVSQTVEDMLNQKVYRKKGLLNEVQKDLKRLR